MVRMQTIAHYIITYSNASWLVNQIKHMQRYRPWVVAWARDIDDDITSGQDFYQAMPQPGAGAGMRKLALAIGYMWETLYGGTTRHLAGRMMQEQTRLIHAHYGRAGYHALPIIRRTGLPLITSFYGYDISEYPNYPAWRRRYERLFAEGDYFMVEGTHMRETLIRVGCPPEKAILQRLGIPLDKVEFKPRQWEPGTPLNVLQVARIREKKGIPDSIRGFAGLHRVYPEARFTLIGDLNSAVARPIMEEVQREVEKHHLEDTVKCYDYVPYEEYLRIMQEAHIFLQPSVTAENGDSEGGAPVSLIEASASGMMIVATRHCDIPEVVLNGKSGLLATEHQPEELTQHLITLAQNSDSWIQMAQTGRAHIEDAYDVRKQIAALEAFYTRVVEAKNT